MSSAYLISSGTFSGSFSAVTVAPLLIGGTGQPANKTNIAASPPQRTITWVFSEYPPAKSIGGPYGPRSRSLARARSLFGALLIGRADLVELLLGRAERALVDGRKRVDEHRLAHLFALGVLAQLRQRLLERRPIRRRRVLGERHHRRRRQRRRRPDHLQVRRDLFHLR